MENKMGFIMKLSAMITIIAISTFLFGFDDELNFIWGEDESGLIEHPENIELNDAESEGGDNSGLNFIFGLLGMAWNYISGTIKSIPILGQMWMLLEWVWAGIVFIIYLLTFQFFPSDMPFILQALIMTPIFAGLLYIMMPIFGKIIEAMGNLIPTT